MFMYGFVITRVTIIYVLLSVLYLFSHTLFSSSSRLQGTCWNKDLKTANSTFFFHFIPPSLWWIVLCIHSKCYKIHWNWNTVFLLHHSCLRDCELAHVYSTLHEWCQFTITCLVFILIFIHMNEYILRSIFLYSSYDILSTQSKKERSWTSR